VVFMPFIRWGKSLTAKHKNQRQEGASYALIVLSCINLLNFADRYVPSAVKSLLKKDLHLSDVQTSLPATGMILVYMVAALFFGWIADMRILDRRLILAGGIASWSLVTALAGVSQSFGQLLVFRSLIGVGEAAYMTIVPPMIADFYPIADRNMAYLVFSLSAPLGGALGFVAGSVLGPAWSWRVAFFVCGFPGILVSLLVLTLNDPSPGVNDPDDMRQGVQELQPHGDDDGGGLRKAARKSALGDVRDIVAVPHWIVSEIGMIACSFTVGAMADWYATFLFRTVPGVTIGRAGLVVGACTLLGGVGGSILGSQVAEVVKSRCRNAFLLVSGLFMVPSTVLIYLAVNWTVGQYLSYALGLLSQLCFFTYLAPLNAVMTNCMPVHLRARAGALSILLSHVLGDLISPPIVGAISDGTRSLRAGMQLCWAMSAVAGVAWITGGLLLPPLPGSAGDADDAGPGGVAALPVKEPKAPQPSLLSLLSGEGEAEEEEEPPAALAKDPSGYGAAASVQA